MINNFFHETDAVINIDMLHFSDADITSMTWFQDKLRNTQLLNVLYHPFTEQ